MASLGLPPHEDAEPDVHFAYTEVVAEHLRDQVQRHETPGMRFTIGWVASFFLEPDSQPPGEIEVSAFYCLGCTRLHRRVVFKDDDGVILAGRDFDTGADLISAFEEEDDE